MPDGANKGSFVQAYNAQSAVDGKAQIIVANVARMADTTSADAGYFSEVAVAQVVTTTNLLVPPHRLRHDESELPTAPITEPASISDRMREKVKSAAGRALYKMHKAIVEPVFGRSKRRGACDGFRSVDSGT